LAIDLASVGTWGPINNPGELQNNYFRVPFDGAPDIVATAYLNELSTGELNGIGGTAVAAFKRFEFFDDAGVVQETELTTITSWIYVPRCVSITIAFDLRAAFANAGWTFYRIA
jgi:hypothetical protein